jgi:class 3 adenylate cyclase
VLFADLVGSTALSARLDPEEMREVLRSYQDAAAGAVARFGGHVAKLMGDGVLAYFGWPRAHEDDAERAVRAGLGIAGTVPRLATPAGEPLAARVGIAAGLVVVGDLIGEEGAQEEAVVGETPNLAARLQEAAEPGAVVVADGTRRLLGEVFELRALGPTRLKGFEHPVPCFRVAAERPAESRFEARQPGRPLPMVGRDQDSASCSSAGGGPRPARAKRCCWSARPGSASPGWSGPRSTRSRARSTPPSATNARPTTLALLCGR